MEFCVSWLWRTIYSARPVRSIDGLAIQTYRTCVVLLCMIHFIKNLLNELWSAPDHLLPILICPYVMNIGSYLLFIRLGIKTHLMMIHLQISSWHLFSKFRNKIWCWIVRWYLIFFWHLSDSLLKNKRYHSYLKQLKRS